MYRLEMYHTIKTLLDQGHSQRKIAKELGVHRMTVKRIAERLGSGEGPGRYERDSVLSAYEDRIRSWLPQLSGVLIHERLKEELGLEVSYSTVMRTIRRLNKSEPESFVPLICGPGEEAQVDFGDAGRFGLADGRRGRVWVFVMVLSYSRQAYYEVVRDQRVSTFIRCQRHAFEYFGGVPQRVKLDNLKAGVMAPSFYEPVLQHQYAEFLSHYGCAGTPCRVRKPEHKGKVESGVDYVKKNFFRRLDPDDRLWEGLQGKLAIWTEKANGRRHGTTRKIVSEEFEAVEKAALLPLPAQRYEFLRWEQRTVNRYGHISFDRSYYSVPCHLVGQQLIAQTNESVLRVMAQGEEVAIHALAPEAGSFVTRQEHFPPHKQEQSIDDFRDKLSGIGPSALAFLEMLYLQDRHHWKEKARGILSLCKQHPPPRIDQACALAMEYQLASFRSLSDICQRMAQQPDPPDLPQIANSSEGFHHDLARYDQL